MAVRKAGARLTIEFQASGVRVFRRLPEWATKADAQALEARIRRELWERSALGRKDEPSLAAAIQLWLNATESNRKDKLNPRRNAVHLRPFVEGKTIRQVGEVARAAISHWGAIGVGTPTTALTPATINRRIDVLRASVRWAWKQGLVTDNLSGRVPRLREENARQIYLTAAQVRKLAAGAPNRLTSAAIMIAAYTGLRAGELLNLTKASTQRDTLEVRQSKTGKPRSVPIITLLRPYLRELPLDCSYRRLIGWFWEARKKAGMEHVQFRDLRHSCASMLINRGVDLYTVGKILGHTTPMTTQRYSHLNQTTLRKAMNKLK